MNAHHTRTEKPSLSPHPTLPEYYASSENKRGFVREIFNHTAPDYNRVERMMALGSGPWYRRRALTRAGLTAGLDVLDVAMGTGLVAREAVALAGNPDLVIGLDPSIGMVSEARRSLPIRIILARGEQLPVRSESFDFLSMGYALRHVSDIDEIGRAHV